MRRGTYAHNRKIEMEILRRAIAKILRRVEAGKVLPSGEESVEARLLRLRGRLEELATNETAPKAG